MAKAKKARRVSPAPSPRAAATPPPLAPPSGWVLPCAVLVAAAALGSYLLTLAPTATLIDSGELIVAARTLGVAHPPGFPVYVLLAHAATWLPWGSVAVRVNAASAIFAALAAGVLVLAAREILLDRGAAAAPPGTAGSPEDPRRPRAEPLVASSPLALVPLLVAGGLFAFSRTFWSYATLTEVYTLNALLVAAVLALLLRARSRPSDLLLHAAAVVFGLALGVHHATVLLTLPALALLGLGSPLRRRLTPRRLATLSLACLAAVGAAYAYLPWAASREPFLSWGDPVTLERLVWHVTGRQYQVYLSASLESLGEEARMLAHLAVRQFGPPWLPAGLALAGLGLVALYRRGGPLFASLAVLVAGNVAYALLYSIAEDKDAYYLPTWMALCLAAGAGTEWILRASRRRSVLAPALLAVPLLALAANLPWADRSRYFVADDYVSDALAAVAPNGLLLTADWQLYSPLLYFQEIEGRRRDVTAVDVNLLRRSWYVEALRRRHPELALRAEPALSAFLEDLVGWEHDPERYARDAGLGRRINERFHSMILALAEANRAVGPVYATVDLVTPTVEPEVARLLGSRYALVPEGLVFELAPGALARPLRQVPLRARGLFDGSLRLEADDVALVKVRPVYVEMAAYRGRYLELSGDRAGAEAAYREALRWDPGHGPARLGLQRLAAAPRP